MDILTAILACSLYLEDDALVRAIAESNSHGNPYFVLDASVDPTEVDPPPIATTVEGAMAHVHDMQSSGGRPLLGLMQVPPAWLEAFGRDLADGFDACTNVAVGSAMLSQFAYECGHEAAAKTSMKHARRSSGPASNAAALRPCIERKYADTTGAADFVLVTTLELRYLRPRTADVTAAPIFAPEGSLQVHRFGPENLLVSARWLTALTPSSISASPTPP